MRKGTFARLETRQQGRRLFLLSWTAYAAAYVGRYNYSAVMAAATALMLGINTMFINVMPVRAGRRAGAAFLSGSLNAITYLGAAIATWGIGAAAQGFGWGAVLALWAVMAGTALAVCLLLARRWGRFALACETERGERV